MRNRTSLLVAFLLVLGLAIGVVISCGGSSSSGTSGAADDDSSPSDDDDNDDASPADDDAAETVWTDTTTGFMWQNGAAVGTGFYDWTDAKNYCAALSWDGYSGWQLPDIDQLRTLVRGCIATVTGGACTVSDASSCLDLSCGNTACGGCADLGGPGPGGAYWPAELSGILSFYYWSSSGVADYNAYAWYINFGYGQVSDEAVDNPDMIARCVRVPPA